MGLLDGDLQQMFGGALAPLLLEGRHYHKQQEKIANGDMSRTIIKTQGVKAFRETTNSQRRPQEFTDKDARLIVLQTYDGRVIDAPVESDEIKLEGTTWTCGRIVADAANTHWVIEVTRA